MRILANWRWIAPLFVVLVVGIAASLLLFRPATGAPKLSGESGTTAAGSTSATLVRTRSNLNISSPQPLSRTTTDVTQVQHLYAVVRGLKPVPSNAIYYCPIDFGVQYQLTFRTASGILLTATIDPAGCRFLSIGNQGYYTTDAFWSALENTFNVTDKDLQDMPPRM
jgi:hypothetical protein